MGQTYLAVNPEKREVMSPHEYDNGGKLMEHGFIDNEFVAAVEVLLRPKHGWYKQPLVWAGDYGDTDAFMTVAEIRAAEKATNLNHIARKFKTPRKVKATSISGFTFIVNHTKQEYVDLEAVPAEIDGLQIHPLPLLTASGNNRGSGDYNGSSMYLVGHWAGDKISMENKAPAKFLEIVPDFIHGVEDISSPDMKGGDEVTIPCEFCHKEIPIVLKEPHLCTTQVVMAVGGKVKLKLKATS